MIYGNSRIQNLDSDFEGYASASRNHPTKVDISFVIPVYNEEDSLEELAREINSNVPSGSSFEIIFIDDGSTDESWQVIEALADVYFGHIRGIRFRSNQGKAAGLQAGFDAAVGEIIFTMDADLQDDPVEIRRFLEKIEEGYDLVSGWKKVRNDPWHKVLPSRVFNKMLSYFSKVKLHDHNCGFKCYRKNVAKSIKLFGELHRMVPSLAGMQGFRVTEIPVKHHARRHGVSKYGIERFIRGFSDMLTIGFLRKFRERPSHFANTCSAAYASIALILMVVAAFVGITSPQGTLAGLIGICFIGFSGACFVTGLFAELMIRQNRIDDNSAVINEVGQAPEPATKNQRKTVIS